MGSEKRELYSEGMIRVQKQIYLKYLFLVAAGLLLAMLTPVLAAVPMRLVRQGYGRGPYWIGHLVGAGILVLAGLSGLAFGYAVLLLLIGAYSELEEAGGSIFVTSLLAIFCTAGIVATSAAVWMKYKNIEPLQFVKTQLETYNSHAVKWDMQASLNADSILPLLPAIALVFLVLSLAAGLVWERGASRWVRLPQSAQKLRMDLTSYRVPDVFVWVTMVAILGAFTQHKIAWFEVVSENLLVALITIYFFQGLAIIVRSFRAFRVSPYWQFFFYLLIVLQLVPLVSLLGYVDFWLDFRLRLAKKVSEINKSYR